VTHHLTCCRLISERTVEESILAKADQKRRLGEVAIEEAHFTLDFFKQSNIRDLFELPADDCAAATAQDSQPLVNARVSERDLEAVSLAMRRRARESA
jgi:hypothetical protein